MAVELATGYVSIVPTATGITSNLTKLLAGPAAQAGQQAGVQAGAGMASGVGSKSAGIGSTLRKNAVLPILGVGVAAFASAKNVEDAYNRIRVGTGATGKTLEGLEGSFRRVAKQTPADLGQVGQAVADVNTRLGLTGKPLEDVSLRLVRLSDLTGTDLQSNVASLTRVFGDWSIPTEGQADALDKVFRASQLTGIGIDELATNVVDFGSPLRQMGFSLDDSLALFSRFEKEGVNTSTVLSGLKYGLGQFAKAGKDPQKALADTIDKIKNAGSTAEANSIALSTFGRRAGPDMAAAIREGRFSLAELTAEIVGGKDSIAAATKDTETLGDKFGILKNQAQLALGSLATPVLDALTSGLGKALPVLTGIGEKFGKLPGPVRKVSAGIVALGVASPVLLKLGKGFAAIGKSSAALVKGVGKGAVGVAKFAVKAKQATVATAKFAASTAKSVASIVKQTAAFVAQKAALVAQKAVQLAVAAATKVMTAAQWLLNAALTANPIGLIVAAISALVAGLVLAYVKIKPFRKAVDAVARVVGKVFVKGFELARKAIETVIGFIVRNWPLALAALTGGMSLVVKFIIDHWQQISAVVGAVIRTIVSIVRTGFSILSGVISAVMGVVLGVWRTAWEAIKFVVVNFWRGLQVVVSTALAVLRGVIEVGVAVITAVWSAAWGFVRAVLETAWEGLKAVVSTAINVISAVIGAVLGVISSVWSAVWGGIKATAETIWGGIRATIETVMGVLGTIIGGALDGIKRGWDIAWNGMRTTVDIVTALIKGAWNGVLGALRTAWNAIARTWNNTIGRISFSVPSWVPVVGGKSFDMPNLPTLASGAIVEARSGGTLAILAERGQDEAVLPLPTLRQLVQMVGGAPAAQQPLYVYVDAMVADAQAGRRISEALARYERGSGARWRGGSAS